MALAHLPPDAPKQMLQHKLDQTAPANADHDMPTDSKKSDS